MQSVAPAKVCSGGAQLTVTGTGFEVGATVQLGSSAAASVTVSDPGHLTASFPGVLPAGVAEVTVTNPGGCTATASSAVSIAAGPDAVALDPTVVFSGIDSPVRLLAVGIATSTPSVSLMVSGTATTIPVFSSYSPAAPDQVEVVIPRGLAAGSYDVVLEDQGCGSTLAGALTVSGSLTLSLSGISPSAVRTDAASAVTLSATEPAPQGEEGFVARPRAYLSPVDGGTAMELQGLSFASSSDLEGAAPVGVPPGVYDVVVVNPDSAVGELGAALTVTPADAPPPSIDAVSPPAVPASLGSAPVLLSGANFRSPGASLSCVGAGGAVVTIFATVSSWTSTEVKVLANTSSLGGYMCVALVTNSDGTQVWSPPFGVFGAAPGAALGSMPALNVARRAPSAAALEVSPGWRFVYAIGGDDGSDTGPLQTVEASLVGAWGQLGSWQLLPAQSALPAGRSFAGAVAIPPFIYVVGGRDANGPTDSVLRARALDPADAPVLLLPVVSLTADPGGLPGGSYFYAVSAVVSDPTNPGGESLPSLPQAVEVPGTSGLAASVSLSWSTVPQAVSYRIYRTPVATASSSLMNLVAEVPATQTGFVDDGSHAPTQVVPLPLGSLGVWHEVGPLTTPRQGAGVTAAPAPAEGGTFFIYAIGGLGADGGGLASYEVAALSDGGGSLAPGAFSSPGAFLAGGAWLVGAAEADATNDWDVPPGEVYVYGLSGVDPATGLGTNVAAVGAVNADGTLTVTTPAGYSSSNSAYGIAAGADYILQFGGSWQIPSAGIHETGICGTWVSCGRSAPNLTAANTSVLTLSGGRAAPGSAQLGDLIYILGGTDGGQALSSVDGFRF